jgi:hypothetical protein
MADDLQTLPAPDPFAFIHVNRKPSKALPEFFLQPPKLTEIHKL